MATHYGAGTCTAATLNAAIAALGSLEASLVIPPVPRNSVTPCIWTLNTNVTLPANLRLSIPRGVVLTPGPNVVLEFANPPDVTGPYQIFNANEATTGTVRFGVPGLVHAEWWGAKGDSATDSAVAITQALKSGPNFKQAMTVQLQGGTFLVGSAITPPAGEFVGWTLQGLGRRATELHRTSGYTGTLINMGSETAAAATRVTRVKSLLIDCMTPVTGSIGIRLYAAHWALIEDVEVRQCEYGIRQSGGTSTTYRDVMLDLNTRGLQIDNFNGTSVVDAKLENVHARQSSLYGLNIDGSMSTTIVREVSLYNFIADRAVTGGGNTCLRIHGAERIRMYGIHLEECDPFLSVTDTPTSRVAHVQIYGGQLGDLNPTTAGVGFSGTPTKTPLGKGLSLRASASKMAPARLTATTWSTFAIVIFPVACRRSATALFCGRIPPPWMISTAATWRRIPGTFSGPRKKPRRTRRGSSSALTPSHLHRRAEHSHDPGRRGRDNDDPGAGAGQAGQ